MAASAVDKVFDELGKMSVLDLVELKKKIEDEWGITAAAPVAMAAPGGALAGDGAAAAATLVRGPVARRAILAPVSFPEALRYTSAATSADSAGVTLRGQGVFRYPGGLRRSSCCPRSAPSPFSIAPYLLREAAPLDH